LLLQIALESQAKRPPNLFHLPSEPCGIGAMEAQAEHKVRSHKTSSKQKAYLLDQLTPVHIHLMACAAVIDHNVSYDLDVVGVVRCNHVTQITLAAILGVQAV
jgi:hypothetical protein